MNLTVLVLCFLMGYMLRPGQIAHETWKGTLLLSLIYRSSAIPKSARCPKNRQRSRQLRFWRHWRSWEINWCQMKKPFCKPTPVPASKSLKKFLVIWVKHLHLLVCLIIYSVCWGGGGGESVYVCMCVYVCGWGVGGCGLVFTSCDITHWAMLTGPPPPPPPGSFSVFNCQWANEVLLAERLKCVPILIQRTRHSVHKSKMDRDLSQGLSTLFTETKRVRIYSKD